MIRLIPAADRASPRQSTGGVRGSREVGTHQAVIAATTAVTGTKNRKMLPHQNRSSSHPSAIGPSAIPTPALAPHTPMASARSRRAVNTLVSSDSVDGNIIAAPSPITASRDQLAHGGGERPGQAGGTEHPQARQQH